MLDLEFGVFWLILIALPIGLGYLDLAREIATGQGIDLERTADREFLLTIQNHRFEYDELIEMVEQEKSDLQVGIERSPLPDHVDAAWAGELLLSLRVEQLKRFPL